MREKASVDQRAFALTADVNEATSKSRLHSVTGTHSDAGCSRGPENVNTMGCSVSRRVICFGILGIRRRSFKQQLHTKARHQCWFVCTLGSNTCSISVWRDIPLPPQNDKRALSEHSTAFKPACTTEQRLCGCGSGFSVVTQVLAISSTCNFLHVLSPELETMSQSFMRFFTFAMLASITT